MEFRVLGPLEVREGTEARSLGGPRQRAALVHLLRRANDPVSQERLIDEVWGDDAPPAARSSLQSYVSRLRTALGSERLEGTAAGYVLHSVPEEVDASRFEALVQEARRQAVTDPALAVLAYQEAVGLWRGPALEDLADQPSLQPEIARLEELRMAATEERIAAELALGRHRELVAEAETLVGRHPFRERLWGHLILALYRSGRQREALAAYQRVRAKLGDELGIDPSPELRRLEEQILRQDPVLEIAGQPLRGYRLVERVGEGTFAVVHRAYQPDVGREVAVKVIRSGLANHPEFIRRFGAEAQLVARLEHPHIVPLFDHWREPEGAFLVMRYLRGGSLREALGRGPMEPDRVVGLVEQLAPALALAHRHGVVHRDVKPANILFDDDGNAYLSDFGIAKELVASGAAGRVGAPSPLASYLSPEEARGEVVTPRADIYGLGVVAFEALTGRHPFADTPADALIERHAWEPLPAVRSLRPDLPGAVEEVIARATAKNPAERHPDAMVLAAALREAMAPTTRRARVAAIEARNPYKGLLAFEEADAADYLGRDRLVDEVVARMGEDGEDSRFLAVVGPSGSGKSSLVRAGVVPALRRGAVPGSHRWFIVEMHPGAHPFEELAASLTRIAVAPLPGLAERLEREETGLLRAVEEILPGDGSELVLVIDQFEEIFTLVDEEGERSRFLSSVAAAATDPRSRVRVIATLRADFYDRPLTYRTLAELVRARTATVTPLTPEELERAVSGPAEAVGIAVDPPLVAEIVADVADQPAALPLLQYALTELFDHRTDERLTLEAYHHVGGVSGALARRAEDLYGRLSESGKEVARQLFLRLLTVGEEGSEDTRRRVLRAELSSLDVEAEAIEATIDAFGAHRLLSFDRDPVTRGPTVEVAHEALLREWGRLRWWIDAARDDVRDHRRLASAAGEWREGGRDPSFLLRGDRLRRFETWAQTSGLALTAGERHYLEASLAEQEAEREEEEARAARERRLERRSLVRLRVIVAVLAVLALVASGLTVLALTQRERARRESRIATARELAAAADANLGVDPERSILLALEALERSRPGGGRVLREAENVLHRAVTASRIELRVPGVGGSVDWSPDGTVFVTESPAGSGAIDIRDARTGDTVQTLVSGDGTLGDAVFNHDGTILATVSEQAARLWDPGTGELLDTLDRGPNMGTTGPSLSRDGSLFASVWPVGVVVFDVESGRYVRTITSVPSPWVTSFDPTGARLAIGSNRPEAAVVDVASGDQVVALEGHRQRLTDIAWSPDGESVATASTDGSVRVFDPDTGRQRVAALETGSQVHELDWSPDATRLVSGHSDGTARVWQVTGGGAREVVTVSAHDTRTGITGVAFSPDGSRLLTGDAGLTAARIWDVSIAGDAEIANLPAVAISPGAVDYTPDGRRIVASSDAGSVAVWDAQSFAWGERWAPHPGRPRRRCRRRATSRP